jgi:hypothetical protein
VASTQAKGAAYTLTARFPGGRPLGYAFVEDAGPMRVRPVPGMGLIEGCTTGSGGEQGDGGPNLLGSITLNGLVRWHSAMKRQEADITVTDATAMYDDAGTHVPRNDQFSYEGKVLCWQVLASSVPGRGVRRS